MKIWQTMKIIWNEIQHVQLKLKSDVYRIEKCSYDTESLVLMPVYYISVRWPRDSEFRVGISYDRRGLKPWAKQITGQKLYVNPTA